jgi:hypothetical protein
MNIPKTKVFNGKRYVGYTGSATEKGSKSKVKTMHEDSAKEVVTNIKKYHNVRYAKTVKNAEGYGYSVYFKE